MIISEKNNMTKTDNKLLIISTRNLNSFDLPSGEANLVFGRAYSLWKTYGLKTDIIDFLLPHNFYRIDPQVYDVGFGTIKHVLLKSPMEIFLNRQLYIKYSKEAIERSRYCGIILSGSFSERFLPKNVNKYSSKTILADIHGTPLEIIDYPEGRNKVSNVVRYKMLLSSLKNRIKISNGLLVVSNSLLKHIHTMFPKLVAKKMQFIVPCGGFLEMYPVSKYKYMREKWRKRLKIKEGDTLFIISSGSSPWQLLKENIALFQFYNNKFGHAKLLILTRHRDYARRICKTVNLDYKSYIIMTVNRSVYTDILMAGDVGLMLRDKKMTNFVAFPNKFSDYVFSNMLVVTSNIDDVCTIVKRYKIGIKIDDIFKPSVKEIEILNTRLVNRSENIDKVYSLSKEVYKKYLYFPYTLRSLYEAVINKINDNHRY